MKSGNRTFKSKYVIRVAGEDHVVATSELDSISVRGRNFGLAAALIQGDTNLFVPAEDLANAVHVFDGEGLLGEPCANDPSQAAYWELLNENPSMCFDRIQSSDVTVSGVGGASTATLSDAIRALTASGKRVDGALDIVVATDYLDPELAILNARSLEHGRAWMLVRPVGAFGWIGPLFVPGQTPCWSCMQWWMEQNGYFPGSAIARTLFSVPAVELFAANEAVKWLATGFNDNVQGVLCSIDTRTLCMSRNVVLGRPRCPSCGGGMAASVRDLISPITGLIGVQRESHARPGLVIVDAVGSRQLCRDGAGRLLRVPQDRVTGAGTTAAEAVARCTSESVERYCAQFHGDEYLVHARFTDVRRRALHPNSLMLFSSAQFTTRKEFNTLHGGKHYIPTQFDAQEETAWVKAQPLTGGSDQLVPAGCCYRGFNAPHQVCDSNGCASAADEATAILSALLELVERDAVALWWYNRLRRPAVRIQGLSAETDLLLRFFAERRRSIHVLDLTTGFGIPVYAAVSATPAGTAPVVGSAAGSNAQSAVWKALAECAASLEALESFEGAARRADERAQIHWFRTATCDTNHHLMPTEGGSMEPTKVSISLDNAIHRLEAEGIKTYLVRLTRPELAIPAVRVLAPGLRPWLARYAPGRLYDEPVRLGWSTEACDEQALNPVPYPF